MGKGARKTKLSTLLLVIGIVTLSAAPAGAAPGDSVPSLAAVKPAGEIAARAERDTAPVAKAAAPATETAVKQASDVAGEVQRVAAPAAEAVARTKDSASAVSSPDPTPAAKPVAGVTGTIQQAAPPAAAVVKTVESSPGMAQPPPVPFHREATVPTAQVAESPSPGVTRTTHVAAEPPQALTHGARPATAPPAKATISDAGLAQDPPRGQDGAASPAAEAPLSVAPADHVAVTLPKRGAGGHLPEQAFPVPAVSTPATGSGAGLSETWTWPAHDPAAPFLSTRASGGDVSAGERSQRSPAPIGPHTRGASGVGASAAAGTSMPLHASSRLDVVPPGEVRGLVFPPPGSLPAAIASPLERPG